MLRLSRVLILGILIIFGYLSSVYAWGWFSEYHSVVISGKIMDRVTLKPVTGAQISVRVNNSLVQTVSSSNGQYLVSLNASSWFRSGSITISRIGYQQQSSFLVIPPRIGTMRWDFKLRDNIKPTLQITSPANGEQVSSTPTIELSYADSGSGINLNSLRIRVMGKEVRRYVTLLNNQKAICSIPQNDPLLQGNGWIEVFIKDFAGNTTKQTVSIKVVDLGGYYLSLAKEALLKRDALSASQYFKQALEAAPQNAQAHFYCGLMRMALLPMQDEVFTLLGNMGFKGPKGAPLTKLHFDPFNLQCVPPINMEKFILVNTFPAGQEAQKIVRDNLIPAIEQTLQDWNIVLKNKDFVSDLEIANPFTGRGKVRLDYGDVAILKSMLLGFESKMYELLVPNAEVNLAQLSEFFYNNGGFRPEYLLEAYPDLLRVKDIPSSINARGSLLGAIDSYKEGSDFILAEKEDQTDHLLSISSAPEYRAQAVTFSEQLQDLKKSILSAPDEAFSMKLSQILNLGEFYNNPFDLRKFSDNDIATYLSNHLLSYLDYAKQNLSQATSTYQEFLPPDNGFYKGKNKEVDFADIAALQTGAETMRMILLGVSAYDLNVDTQPIAVEAIKGKAPGIQEILDRYPRLLYLNDRYLIDEARRVLVNLKTSYIQASNYLLNQEDADQSDDLLTVTPYFKENASRYSAMLESLSAMQEVVIDPRTDIKSDQFRLNLGNFFLQYKDVRPFAPRFDANNRIVPNTWLDETFGGILPEHKF